MTQLVFSDINPNTTSGTALAGELNDFRDSFLSLNGGTARPSYAVAGTVWRDETSATLQPVYVFDGTEDVLICVIDVTNNKVRIAVDVDQDTYIAHGATDDEIEVIVSGSVVGKFTSAGYSGGLISGGDIIPDADSSRDLGSPSIAWAMAYLDAIEPVGSDTTIKRVGGAGATPIVDGIAKAWVNFNGTGAIAARDSFNVASLTDNGTGDYTINLTNAFSTADYVFGGNGGSDISDGRVLVSQGLSQTNTTSALRFATSNSASASLTDFSRVYVAAMGDLA